MKQTPNMTSIHAGGSDGTDIYLLTSTPSMPPLTITNQPKHPPLQVLASAGEGHAWVKVTPSTRPETPWYQEKQVLEAWIVAVFGAYVCVHGRTDGRTDARTPAMCVCVWVCVWVWVCGGCH